MFTFDGSAIGSIAIEDIIFYYPMFGGSAYNCPPAYIIVKELTGSGEIGIVNYVPLIMIKDTSNMYGCIIDELKPLFGIKKIGTNSVTMKGKFTMEDKRVKCYINDDGSSNMKLVPSSPNDYIVKRFHHKRLGPLLTIMPDSPLPEDFFIPKYEYQLSPFILEITKNIKEILVFRKIVMVSSTKMKNIMVRRKEIAPGVVNSQIVDYGDENTSFSDEIESKKESWLSEKEEKIFFPQQIYKKKTLKGMLKQYEGRASSKLLEDIRDVINRINDNYFLMAVRIGENIDSLL